MQLRKITHQGHPVWPPIWDKCKDTAKTVTGEVGVLKFVHAQAEVSSKCYIVMDCEGEKYVGELVFHDRTSCQRIAFLLRSSIGRSIKETGDIDIA
jgi:hypothetical protein